MDKGKRLVAVLLVSLSFLSGCSIITQNADFSTETAQIEEKRATKEEKSNPQEGKSILEEEKRNLKEPKSIAFAVDDELISPTEKIIFNLPKIANIAGGGGRIFNIFNPMDVETAVLREMSANYIIEEPNDDVETANDYVEPIYEDVSPIYEEITPDEMKWKGVYYYNGWRWTYYSEKVLPGGGLDIPGRHVDKDGFVCDGEGYICLASSIAGDKGSVYYTPLGRWGKVYDYCAGADQPTMDLYVSW